MHSVRIPSVLPVLRCSFIRSCAAECRLSRSDVPWSCAIELHFITDKNGQSLGQARNEAFGDTIFDKSAVEDRIRRAQRVILNLPQQATPQLLGRPHGGYNGDFVLDQVHLPPDQWARGRNPFIRGLTG
jgi:hypothetical protein